ncbi:MAG: sigma-70 family RNA polymerase sigma factor, partial [Oligoflexales bacterium]|nr:sigma-70 family RNA polymerase sigma factor [Oligoflexales bacterium]
IEQHELTLYSTPLQQKSSNFSEKIANEADNDSPSILLELIENETHKTLKQAIALLPEQMQNVLKLYYFDNLSLKMIATLLNVTESRVSQIHREAIETLRKRAIKAF